MKIAVFGAGSIGTYFGGALLASGADVILVGCARMHDRIRRQGLELTDLHGRTTFLEGDQVPYAEDPTVLADADLVLVTVKSADTSAAAAAIGAYARPDAMVISLQNGVGNPESLRQALPGRTVLGGVVPFNVVQIPDGRLHRGTEGEIMVEASAALEPWHDIFEKAHLPLVERSDFTEVQWGKLLLTLNNAVNALTDLPLETELSQRACRRSLALLVDEALDVLRAAGIRPAQIGRITPDMLPRLLRLPDFIFKRVASSMLHIDPEARSSMWEDLQAGRKTEVDYLNGAVARLAEANGCDAPANRRIVELVHEAEKGGAVAMDGKKLLRQLMMAVGPRQPV